MTVVLLLSVALNCCNNLEEGANQDKSGKKVELNDSLISGATLLNDSSFGTARLRILFNEDSVRLLIESIVGENRRRHDLGRISNSFGTAPFHAEMRKINDSLIGIIIISNIVQLGISMDNLFMYSFNTKKSEITEQVSIHEIAQYHVDKDTLNNMLFYEWDLSEASFIYTEFRPYKLSDNPDFRYKTLRKEYSLRF